MSSSSIFDARPIIVAIAGPNGAGKSTFYAAHLKAAALRSVNADDLAREVQVDPYEAAKIAQNVRTALVEQRESFVFETVFSDPVGEKLEFLLRAEKHGYTVVLCYIGLDSIHTSEARVAMRVLQGGHDVPNDKLKGRYPRSLKNLGRAIRELSRVLVYDNSELSRPFRRIAEFDHGKRIFAARPLPRWFTAALASSR